MTSMTRWGGILAIVVCAVLAARPASGNGAADSVGGFLTFAGDCPQAGYVLVHCPCDPLPPPSHYVYSTKIDLSQYAGHFVSMRGSVQNGNCQVPLFQAKRATIEPNRPCPCPASSIGPLVGDGPEATAVGACRP